MRAVIAVALIAAWLPSAAVAMKCAAADAPDARQVVVISDLHFGVGKDADGRWQATEDFRWTKALEGFLHRVSECGKDKVDLVVAGDAFELWQPPKALECQGPSADAGCTPAQLRAILANAISAHRADLALFGAFADRGSNRLYFIPGNHDSGLLLDGAFEMLRIAVGARQNRVFFVATGVFVTEDGRVVIEHGHQIGEDVNGYSEWPTISRRNSNDGIVYIDRPWGEQFVQKIFNEQEMTYGTIDNLSPETAGIRFRMADRGAWSTVGDIARFLKFNLFETSMSQKLRELGGEPDPANPPTWEVAVGRGWGHLLFVRALPDGDPFRETLVADNTESRRLRDELDAMARDPARLSDVEVRQLCDMAAIQSKGQTLCITGQLGAIGQALLVSKRVIMIEHLRKRMRDHGRMRVFVYAHTHLLETPWKLAIPGSSEVTIANTGAFQRVVDEPAFLARAKAANLAPADALRRFDVEDLAACYTAVVVPMRDGLLEPVLVRWHMEESGSGEFVFATDALCQ